MRAEALHLEEYQWPSLIRKKGMKAERKSARRDSVTLGDLKASIGKGPELCPDEIAHTYHSSEEFLAYIEEARDSSPPS